MRHIRSRKRFRAILVALLALTFVLFLESRVESFSPQLRTMVEFKVGEAFGKNLKLSIGDMDGGILRPFVLTDIKIKGKDDSSVFSSFEIKSIKSNFRIWDLLFKDKEYMSVLSMLKEEPCVYVDFVTKNKELSGYIKLVGDVKSADIQGYLILFEKRRVDINGKLRAGSFFVELRPRKGSLRIEGKKSKDGWFLTNVNANHITFQGVDIVCEANLKNRISGDPAQKRGGGYLEGDIQTKRLILNYAVFPDVKISYRLYNGVLNVSSLEIGREIKASGWGSLRDPYNIKLDCTIDNANIASVLSSFGVRANDMVAGTINARAHLKGPLKNLKSDVRISVRKGHISKLGFDSLEGTLKGDGLLLRIEDSRLSRESGYISVTGDIDLRKIGKSNPFSDIRLVTDDNAINWDKYEASSSLGVTKTEMKKKLFDDFNVGFKKFTPGKQIDESVRDKDEVALEYKLQSSEGSDNSLKVSVKEDGNFFGLEHKDKF